MKDEIKEILENIRKIIKSNRENDFNRIIYDCDSMEKLLDYITNLQEKVNQYENPDDMTLFYMWLDEKAKDKIKQLEEKQIVLDDIKEIILNHKDYKTEGLLVEETSKILELLEEIK